MINKKIKNVGLILVSLLLLELVSGYIYAHLPPSLNNGKNLVDIYLGNAPSSPYSIEPHPYLLYQNTRNYYADGFQQNNSQGYRGKEFDQKKSDSSIRILALGGSTTDMYPYIKNPNDTWISQLGDMLREKINPNIETINAGLNYATTAELLASYVFRHQYLNLDILIIHTGGNDIIPLFFENYSPEYTHFRAHGSGIIPRRFERTLLSVSSFIKLIYANWLNSTPTVYQSQPYDLKLIDSKKALERVNQNNCEGFRRNLDTIIKLAKSNGTKVVLFGFLSAKEDFLLQNNEVLKGLAKPGALALKKNYQIMKELSELHEIPFIIPEPSLFDDSWFSDHCHLNEQGEKMKATILFNFFNNSKEFYFTDKPQ
ncbi:MAG: SGNH/GDSL hydrolase family protein [Candidatus Omnitrophota bacterium]